MRNESLILMLGPNSSPSSTRIDIWMSNLTFLQRLGSVRSGLQFGQSKRVATCWCHSFGALRYPYNALCNFQKVLLRTRLGECRHSGMPCAGQLNLRCSHVLGDCFDRASSQLTFFQRLCRWCRCKPSGTTAAVMAIIHTVCSAHGTSLDDAQGKSEFTAECARGHG